MGVKSRLLKLETSLRTNKKKEHLSFVWLEDKPISFKNKMYNNFEELEKEYPTIETDYELINIFITCV